MAEMFFLANQFGIAVVLVAILVASVLVSRVVGKDVLTNDEYDKDLL